MASEKCEGLEVVAWEIGYSNACEVTYDEILALSRERQGLPVRALVRLSDAQAAIERAQEEGRVAAEIRGAVQTLERLQAAGYHLHDSEGRVITAPEYLAAILEALPSPPPEREGGA